MPVSEDNILHLKSALILFLDPGRDRTSGHKVPAIMRYNLLKFEFTGSIRA